jgi:hypothetical protein
LELSRIVGEMLEAIHAERQAVRRALGALGDQPAVGVWDGERQGTDPGAYVYRFRCELDFRLADGTRVRIEAPGLAAVGEVFAHDVDLDRLEVVLREDLGALVPSARLLFDSTYLLDTLAHRLESVVLGAGAFDAERALRFLNGEGRPLPAPPALAGAGLSESQRQATGLVLSRDVAYLWGPPGTGKTRTVAGLVHELVAAGERVLLSAHTNVATDTALVRLLQTRDLPVGAAVRIGACGEALRPHRVGLDDLVDRALLRDHPEVLPALERLCRQAARLADPPPSLLLDGAAPLSRRARVAREILDEHAQDPSLTQTAAALQSAVEQTARDVLDQARVVAATLSGLYTSRLLGDFHADTVIIDEASIASLPLSFLAAGMARRRVLAVGDFQQLPVIVHSDEPRARLWLGRHVFTTAGCDRPDADHPLRAMLTEQWQMHPQISAVVSRTFYAGRLEDAALVTRRAHPGPALLLLDTSRLGARSEHTAARSKHNRVHARLVADLVASARARGVAVIVPYRAQARLIRQEIREWSPELLRSGRVEVFTVHRFQGRDQELVIFDTVESPGTRCRFLDELENPEAPNLVNVALSRARERLIVVASVSHVVASVGRHSILSRVFALLREVGGLEIEAGADLDREALSLFLAAED